LTRSCNDVDDVVQIVEMTIHRFKDVFRGSTRAEYHAWLRQVVYLTVLQLRRNERRKKPRAQTVAVDLDGLSPTDSQDHPILPIDRLILNEELDQLRLALNRLGPDDRELFRLHIYEGLSFQRVADLLHKSQSGIRYNYDRAIRHLISEYIKKPT